VHYIAHSKLDPEREPQASRELFNAFTDNLSVKSANNSMRIGLAKGRPSNDELHHLVLSFRKEDYQKLGADEVRRRRALKEITRAAVKSLEIATNAERLLWTAAVHRNTENPHVHIAIQKQYLSKEIARQTLTKIPREILPHYEIRDGEKILVPGLLIKAAADKMETIIDREKSQNREPKRSGRLTISQEHFGRGTESEPIKRSEPRSAADRDALAKGILAEYELIQIETRIDSLLDHGEEMRFTVTDPVTGRKNRLSLREIQKQKAPNETDRPTSAELQIKTILRKMLVKEEAAKDQLQNDFSDVIREAKRIRSAYRKSGRTLPVPSLPKEELDKLQQQSLDGSDIRRFSYLERIRNDLMRSGEVEPRNNDDLRSILAQKNIADLRLRLYDKAHKEQSERGYYLRFEIGERSVSLADLDRDQKDRDSSQLSFLEKVKAAASRVTKNRKTSTQANQTDPLRNEIAEKLTEQLASIRKDGKVEQNKEKVLASVLSANPESDLSHASYSPEQIAEVEKLSVHLKLKNEYENNWKEQSSIIESARSDSAAYQKLLKADPMMDFAEHKNRIVAGRALAREIIAGEEFGKTKEELKIFQDGKRFQKFAIADKQLGSISYLSLHDVDLPQRSSLLDRTIDELFESREHRRIRRTVSGLSEDKERRLKDDVTAAKEIMVSASRTASEFKEFSYFRLRSDTVYQPIFTSSEISVLESRISKTSSSKEAERLRTLVESAADQSVRSLGDLLRNFESPKQVISEVKEIDIPNRDKSDDDRQEREVDRSPVFRRPERSVERHSR
ncbi:MAG TPA: relaxase MobL, partial [Pyrinomonadaceae bacterium]|nr:relaxase MobL [Pyrinomonadaceae bacterium]